MMDSSPLDATIAPRRLDELIRWHGTDESNLPPDHTLRHLSRDTVTALRELAHSQARIERLRDALGTSFWAEDARERRTLVLAALGPPPADSEPPAAGRVA